MQPGTWAALQKVNVLPQTTQPDTGLRTQLQPPTQPSLHWERADSQGGSLGKRRRAQDKMACRTFWQPLCFSHPLLCCTQGGGYRKHEMMNILLSAGPNLKSQLKINSRRHSLTEKLLSGLLFIVNADNPLVIQSTNIYI